MEHVIVMKFGGTSVADAQRIKHAARRIVETRERGSRVVAVLSARGKTTDELIAMAEEVSAAPDPREMDMLLSTGERISCALCAMAIHDLGHRAISLTGSQAGIVTDESHTKARIIDVRADPLPLLLRGRSRYGCARRRRHRGAAADHRRNAFRRRGAADPGGSPRRTRRRRADLPGARAGQRERRHDRAKRAPLGKRTRRDLVHRSARGPARGE